MVSAARTSTCAVVGAATIMTVADANLDTLRSKFAEYILPPELNAC